MSYMFMLTYIFPFQKEEQLKRVRSITFGKMGHCCGEFTVLLCPLVAHRVSADETSSMSFITTPRLLTFYCRCH